MRKGLSQSSIIALEEVSIPVNLEQSKQWICAIRNDGQGFDLINHYEAEDIPISKEMIPILEEAIKIWYHIKDGVSFDEFHPMKKLRIVR